MTEIALLRHLPTDWNAARRLQGKTDRPLSDASRARLAGLKLPPPWDKARLVASPLIRATETARILTGRRPRTEAALGELSWGDWEGETAEALAIRPDYRPTGDLGWTERAPGGESPAEAWARMRPALQQIARSGGRTLIVSHKGVMRVILSLAAFGTYRPGPGVEIKSARLYPLRLGPGGMPRESGSAIRLVPR